MAAVTGARVGRPRRRSTWRQRDAATGYLFVAPAVLGAVAFVIAPLVAVIWYSLHEWNVLAGTFTFEGAANYERMLSDESLHQSLAASGWFSLGIVVLNISLALALAVLLNQRLPATTFFRVAFFSPVVVSLVAWTIVWGFLLQVDGGVNAFLSTFGIDGPNWLRGNVTAMIAVVVVQVFKNVGLNMVLFLSALQSVPEEIQEAATLDGAGPWRRFWSITMAMISPTVLLVSILTVVGSLETFALIDVLTQGGPSNSTTVLVYYLYRQAFEFNDFGYASAVAVLLFAIVLGLTLLQWQTRKRWVFHEV
ncbi:sugar ABC transporter permease [Georgenia halophila]|uniref:Sugar ABC transporter permease n=1 Tax=Georgenia halophila TaxID=620889 RepID=A0ABP8KSS3_9MICO